MDSDNDNEDKFSTTQPFNYAEPDQPASPDPEEYDENEYSDARNANSLYQQSYSSTQPFSFGTDDAPASPVPEDDADEADGQQHGDSGIPSHFFSFILNSCFSGRFYFVAPVSS